MLILGIVTVSGCTSSLNQSEAAYTVTIQNMAFNPPTVYIQAGTTITWINKDSTSHHVVSDTGVFDSGNLNKGQSYNYTFYQAGNYSYHCSIHPSMTGTILVYPPMMMTSNNTTTMSNGTPVPYSPTPSNPSPSSPTPSTPTPSNPIGTGSGY